MLEALDSSMNSRSERRTGDACSRGRGDFIDLGEALHFGFHQLEGGADGKVKLAGRLEKLFAVGERMAAIAGEREGGEEHAGALAELLGESGHGSGALLAAQEYVGVASQLFKAEVGEGAAEVLRCDIFKLVGLVEDDRSGLRQNAGIGRCRSEFA